MDKPFTIYVMHSAHTDIGYTHPQHQIMEMYLTHYDRVLELCRQTEPLPTTERFKWTCETAWQVQHYLTQRPEREAEFLHFARNGQIEITAGYLHFTDLIDTDAYRRSLLWTLEYCRRNDLPLKCALHSDINGWPWSLADLLAEYNIPFFCTQIHTDSATEPLGQRGTVHYQWLLEKTAELRPDTPFRMPQAFWWQGPKGGRVLHWLGEHYLLGNVLGLSGFKDFNAEKSLYFYESDRMKADELYARAEAEVPRYVARLKQSGYSMDRLLISTGGFYVDNSPPDGRWCEIVARWNVEHTNIKLCTATLSEWMEALNEQADPQWPTLTVAWPDGWAHGLGSATGQIAQERRNQRRRKGVERLVELSDSAKVRSRFERGLYQERLALEHTFGAWSTTAHPGAPANKFLQTTKELYFDQTEMFFNEAVELALREIVPAADSNPLAPSLYVSGLGDEPQTVHFEPKDVKLDPTRHSLRSADGTIYPFQADSLELDNFVATLAGNSQNEPDRFQLVEQSPGPLSNLNRQASASAKSSVVLESPQWRLEIDSLTGGLRSLHEVAIKHEWVNAASPFGFGQLVHETALQPGGRVSIGNDARFVALGSGTQALKARFEGQPGFEQQAARFTTPPTKTAGPTFDAVQIKQALPDLGQVTVSWRCYHALPLVELVLEWDKLWHDHPEAAYVSFPFAGTGGQLELETGGGFFTPGSHKRGGQLAGTASTFYTVQRAARLTLPDGPALLWLPLDAPLVMPQALDFNRWESDEWQWNHFLASMPVNHYWHTNFPISQRGYLRLRYRFLSLHGREDVETAIRMALPVETNGWR